MKKGLLALALLFTASVAIAREGNFWLTSIKNDPASGVFVRIQTTHNGEGNGVYIKSTGMLGGTKCTYGKTQSDIGIGCTPFTMIPGDNIELTNLVVPDVSDGTGAILLVTTYTPTLNGQFMPRLFFITKLHENLYVKEAANRSDMPNNASEISRGALVITKSHDNCDFEITVTATSISGALPIQIKTIREH